MRDTRRVLGIAACLAMIASCKVTAGTSDTTPPVTKVDPTTTSDVKDDSPLIPMDPAVRTGKLANGMTFYIRQHPKPEKRAYLWLAVDAGSVLEDDDQKGLAHFVEHMAFNGTKRFERNTLIDFLERAGMDFGADLNAYTSFDETVYQLKVPTDDLATVSKGFDILEDWAGGLLFDAKEVDKERGVVVEEWRLGRGAGQRIFDKQWPIYLEGSRYADRKPIGEREILEKAPRETLERFYKDWYRPDLMAIVVVGDLDPAVAQAEIEKRFGKLAGPAKPRERVEVPVPLLDKTRAAVITDPEASTTSVSIAIKGPWKPSKTENDHRRNLVERLFHGMLRARLDELRQKPDSPFTFAFSGSDNFRRAVDVFDLRAGVKTGRIEDAARTLLVEVERVRQHGFLAAELERERARSMRAYERALAEKDTVDGRAYAFGAVRAHLDRTSMPSRALELELAKRMLPAITLEEVNALAGDWTKQKDRVVLASGPARDEMPTDAALLAVASSVEGTKVTPYEDRGGGGALMATKPVPGKVVKTDTIAEIGVTVWTLSNGAKVVVKPTDFKKDEVTFDAFSPGGHSLVGPKRYHSAAFADAIINRSGIGTHDAVSLRNLMAGRVANVSPWIAELEEGMGGSGSPQDLELLLQMVHLYGTAPRRDADAFAAWKASTAEFVRNRDLNPQQVFFEKFNTFRFNNHLRRQAITVETLDKVSLDDALAVYQDRFADFGDFTFVLVGNVDLATLQPLVETYLASLPTKKRKEKWKDVGARTTKGAKSIEVAKGVDPKSYVMMTYHGTTKWTADAEDDIEILADVMDIRLREVLREDMSGVYGAFSRGSIARRPRQEYGYTIGFGCGPENADKLQAAVTDIVASLKKDGIGEDYLGKVKEKRRRELETSMRENRFWARQLGEHFRYGTDPKSILELGKVLERVTSDNVKASAAKFLNERSKVAGVLVPETGKPASAKPTDNGTAKPADKPTPAADPKTLVAPKTAKTP